MFKFRGSIGRVGWMRRHFPDAVHIVVMRDPFTQFASAARQFIEAGNTYFLATPLALLAFNRDLPVVSRCTRHLGVELPDRSHPGVTDWRVTSRGAADRGTINAMRAACETILRNSGVEVWYSGFLAFWVAAAAMLPDTIDLIIESDALARSGSYRLACEIELMRLTGRMIDFGDVDCSGDTTLRDAPRPRVSCLPRAHAAAEAFLAEQLGSAWADAAGPGLVAGPALVAGLLARARLLALDPSATRPASPATLSSSPADSPETAAALLSAEVRAACAERQLAALWASRSWRMTAPLRWLHKALR